MNPLSMGAIKIAQSVYTTGKHYFDGPDPQHKMHKFVEHLKEVMNDPSLSHEQKIEIADKIAEIEGKAKDKKLFADCIGTALVASKLVAGFFGGPVGVAVEAYTTSDTRRSLADKSHKVVLPAEKVAGRRHANRKNKSGNDAQKGSITKRAMDATSTVAQREITNGVVSEATSLVNYVWNMFG